MSVEQTLKALREIGWTRHLSAEKNASLERELVEWYQRDPVLAYLGLSTGAYDIEAIGDEDDYAEVVREYVRVSDGRFNPCRLRSRFEYGAEAAVLAFTLGGQDFEKELSLETGDYVSEELEPFLNEALARTGFSERFFTLPMIDQIARVVFVPPEAYQAAVDAGVIPTSRPAVSKAGAEPTTLGRTDSQGRHGRSQPAVMEADHGPTSDSHDGSVDMAGEAAALSDTNAERRILAAQRLTPYRLVAPGVIDALSCALEDDDWRVREKAAEAICFKTRPGACGAAPALRRLALDRSKGGEHREAATLARAAAIRALWVAASDFWPECIAAMIEVLEDDSEPPEVLTEACDVLLHCSRRRLLHAALPVLKRRRLSHHDERVRKAADRTEYYIIR